MCRNNTKGNNEQRKEERFFAERENARKKETREKPKKKSKKNRRRKKHDETEEKQSRQKRVHSGYFFCAFSATCDTINFFAKKSEHAFDISTRQVPNARGITFRDMRDSARFFL